MAGVDHLLPFTQRSRAANNQPINTPAGPVPSMMAPPRINLLDHKVVLPPAFEAIKTFDDLVEFMGDQLARMDAWAQDDPAMAAASLQFYHMMGQAALDLANGNIHTADLYLRWFAFLSPRASVPSNAAKAVGAGAAAVAAGVTPGFKAGTLPQVQGMSVISDEWQSGEAFAMHLPGVDNKVRNFYLNGAAELLKIAQEQKMNDADVLALAQRLSTSLEVSVKTRGGVGIEVASLQDIPALMVELDRLVTSDMWDQAALGNVTSGFVIHDKKDKSAHMWVDPRGGQVFPLTSPEAQEVLDWHKKNGEFAKQGIKTWSDLTPYELDSLQYDPVAETVRIFSLKDDGESLLAAGGESATYDISQAFSGVMADVINSLGGMAGKARWTAYNVQEFRWGMEKIRNPRPSMRDFSSYDQAISALREFAKEFEGGGVRQAMMDAVRETIATNQSKLDELRKEMAEKKKPTKAQLTKQEKLETLIREGTQQLKDLETQPVNASLVPKEIDKLVSKYAPQAGKGSGAGTAIEAAFASQARQLMPFEIQSEAGGKLYKDTVNAAADKLEAEGEAEPVRTLIERMLDSDFIGGFQKVFDRLGLPVVLRNIWSGEGSYLGTLSPNLLMELSGPRWATTTLNMAVAEALEQTGGNLIRRPSLNETLAGVATTPVIKIPLPEGFTSAQIAELMTRLGKITDSNGKFGGDFIGGHSPLVESDGTPVIAIHGGFYKGGNFLLEIAQKKVEIQAEIDAVFPQSKDPESFFTEKLIVEAYSQKPEDAYARPKRKNQPDSRGGGSTDSGIERGGDDQVGPDGNAADSSRRDLVQGIRGHVLASVRRAAAKGQNAGRQQVNSTDVVSRLIDHIAHAWEVEALRRGGDKAAPLDPMVVAATGGETVIKTAVLPTLSAQVIAEGLENRSMMGITTLMWDIAQRVARKGVAKVDIRKKIPKAELEKLNKAVIARHADKVNKTKNGLGFVVYGGVAAAPRGFGAVEQADGGTIIYHKGRVSEKWKTGDAAENIQRAQNGSIPAIRVSVEIGSPDAGGYGYAVTYVGEDMTPTSVENLNEETGRRKVAEAEGTEQEETDQEGESVEGPALSIGPAQVADVMAGNALARITDPRRRTQVMSRIARDFNAMRLQIDRMATLSGFRRSKSDMRAEAMARQELRAEELIADVHRRFGEIMADDDLVKIKAQPVHAFLSDPSSPLRGRLKSKAAAIREHPDMFQLHRAGDYDGSDGVSRSVFGGTRMPDQAAQELYDNGLIPEPTADAMWEALMSEQKTVAGMKELLERAKVQIREAKAQAKQEATEWLATQGKDQEVNFSDKEEIRRSLRMLDAILLALPPEIRGKIGGYTQMAMITTDAARLAYLKDKLAKADKELETFLRIQYAAEWEALLKKAAPAQNESGQRPTGSIAADAYDIFRIAEAAMGMSFAVGEAEADKWDAIADHPDTEAKDADIARVNAQMIRLTMNWTAADAARREQAVLEGEKIYFDGLAALRKEASRRRERLGQLRDSAITGTRKSGSRMEREAAIRAAKGNKGREALQMAWEFLSFGQVVNVLFGEASAAARWFNARELAASNAFEDAFQAKANAIEALFVTLAGSRFQGEVLKNKMTTDLTIKVKDALGIEHEFSDSQAITFLLMWRQEDGQRHMRGLVDEETQATISQWAWNDASAAAIEAQLSPAGHAAMAFLGQSYGEEYGRINAVFRRIWNVSMPRHKMYSPLSVAPAQGKADTIMDPVSGDTMGAGMTPGSLKNRSFSAIAEPLFKDAFQVYVSHARQMEHFIAYGEFSRDSLAIVNRREARNAIEAAGGPFAAGVLSKWLDFFAVGGVKDANMGGAVARTVGGAIGRLSQAALVGRVSVLAMQSLQLVAAPYQMPVGAFLTRLAKLKFGRLAWGAAVNSEYIQRRIAIMPPIVRDAVQGLASGTPNRAKYYAAELGKTISGADALFTGGTYAIFYDYHLKLAKASRIPNPEAHAHSEAERLTDQVAQPVRIGARSWLEVANQGNPAFRAMWNFSSDPRQKVALLVYAAMRRDTSAPEKTVAVGKALIITWLGSGVLAALLRAAIRDLRDDDDDEWFDERHWSAKRLGLMALTGPFGAMPYFGEVAENFTYKMTGQYMPSGGLLSSIGDAAGVVPSWLNGDFDLLKDAEKILTAGAAASGTSAALANAMHILRDAWGVLENLEGPDPD
jgi:hypothetical protein